MKRNYLIGLACLLVCVLVGTFSLVWNNNIQAAISPMPDVVQIVRHTMPIPGKTAPPFSKRISDPTIVQQLYTVALAAPVVPKGAVYHCPMDNGVTFQLTFLKDTIIVQHMTLNATGCEFLVIGSGSDVRRSGVGNPSFYDVFRKATGLRDLSNV